MIYWVLIIIFVIIFAYLLLIFYFENKLINFEEKIRIIFEKKASLIPSLKSASQDFIKKQDIIFSHIIILRTKQMALRNDSFLHFINVSAEIEHEIDFIIKVLEKNQETQNSWKTLYIIDEIKKISIEIDKNMEIYKKVTKWYNKLVSFKNLTIIWLFLYFPKK